MISEILVWVHIIESVISKCEEASFILKKENNQKTFYLHLIISQPKILKFLFKFFIQLPKTWSLALHNEIEVVDLHQTVAHKNLVMLHLEVKRFFHGT